MKAGLEAMFTLFLRAIFLYGLMILTMRLLGKRQLGEFEPYELALTILLADIVSSPIESVSTPLFYGILPVAAVIPSRSRSEWEVIRALYALTEIKTQ